MEGFGRIDVHEHETLLDALSAIGWTQTHRAQYGTMSSHSHGPAHEFCYIIEGAIHWWVGDQVYELEPGQIFMTFPHEPHGGLDGVLHPCEIYWVQVDLTQPESLGMSHEECQSIRSSLAEADSRICKASPLLLEHFQRILEEHRFPQPHSHHTLRGISQVFLHDLARAYKQHPLHSGQQTRPLTIQIRRAITYLSQCIGDKPSISKAADMAGLRPTQFRTRCKQETGVSPQAYFQRLRLREAQRRLRESSSPITEIAHGLGFNSSQHFAGHFKKNTGLSPSQYRKKSSGT